MLILTRSRVGIISVLVFTSDSHFLGTVSKFLEMTIVLARIRSNFPRDLIAGLFPDDGSLATRFSLTNSSIRFILTRCRVCIIGMLVLTTNCHFLRAFTKRLQMTIVHSWIRRVFFWDLESTFGSNDCSFTSWFSHEVRSFWLINTRTWMRLVLVRISPKDCDLVQFGPERLEMLSCARADMRFLSLSLHLSVLFERHCDELFTVL